MKASNAGATFFVNPVLLLILAMVALGNGSAEAQSESVANPTVTAASRSPGQGSTYTVEFTANEELPVLTGEIYLELDYLIRVPSGISGNSVTVRYRKGSDYGSGQAGWVEVQQGRSRNSPTTISVIPDVEANDQDIPIPAGARVTVTLLGPAGIRNPQEGGAYPWRVSTSEETTPQAARHPNQEVIAAFSRSAPGEGTEGLLVDREVILSKQEIGRGEEVSATARGYRPGTAITFWRDADADGTVDPDEREFCQSAVNTGGDANCSFLITSPPFAGGFGQCLNAPRTCNLVNARDGEGSTAVLVGTGTNQVYKLDNLVELVGTVKARQDPGRGEQISINLTSFPQGTVEEVTVSQIPADLNPMRVGPEGDLDFQLPVPQGVRSGRQQLEVTLVRSDNGQEYTARTIVDITSGRTEVTVDPGTVTANGRILVTGVGFHAAGGAHIAEMRISGETVELPVGRDGSRRIPITDTGTFAQVVTVPVTRGTLTPGLHELMVTDNAGRTGYTGIRILERKITLHPEGSRPGSMLEVRGTGFPACSACSSGTNIMLSYESGNQVTHAHAETDDQGQFVIQIEVPRKSHPGSLSTVTVEFFDDDGGTMALQANHRVIQARVVLEPNIGPPGTVVSLTGEGFREFTLVRSVLFESEEVNPGGGTATDAHGVFSTRFVVPGIDTGLQQVTVTVDGAVAAAAFRVTQSDLVTAGATEVGEALADLAPHLEVVWHFDNDSKRWTFYDGLHGGNLDYLRDGQTYLVQVKGDVEVYLNNRPRAFSCYLGNCWNQIIW